MLPGLLPILHERANTLAEQIEDGNLHFARARKLVENRGGGVEGIGVVLVEMKSIERNGLRRLMNRCRWVNYNVIDVPTPTYSSRIAI